MILDAWAKPTLGPTQEQYSVLVAMFSAFGGPPSDVRLIRLKSKVDSIFSKIPIERTFFLNITVTMLRTYIHTSYWDSTYNNSMSNSTNYLLKKVCIFSKQVRKCYFFRIKYKEKRANVWFLSDKIAHRPNTYRFEAAKSSKFPKYFWSAMLLKYKCSIPII